LEHLERFERSGLSQAEFCRRARIHAATFSLWRRTAKSTPAPAFAEVQLGPVPSTGAAMLHLPSGAKLEVPVGSDATWIGLGLLLKSLQS
jgi:hypothetical protein